MTGVRRVRGAVVTPTGVLPDGVVEMADGVITEVRPRRPRERVHSRASTVLPGFVDMHVHGGGGYTFTTADPAQARAAARYHLGHGTTTIVASLVTEPAARLHDAVREYRPLVESGVLAGLHLEGPYLSPRRCGAQNPAYLRDPDPAELSALMDSGVVRMVTIAPELPGALDAISLITRAGAVAAVGHTDASYEQALEAVRAGATVGTHLGNAMRPVHHRAPGPIIALLGSAEVVCELVADGVHLHDGMLRFACATAGARRVALVTDAIAAAGHPDGEYELGGQAVLVANGVARLARDGAIAGSTLTADAAFRRVVHCGTTLVDAAQMAATTPARVLGLADTVGAIAPGLHADLVLLDENLAVAAVWRGGIPVS
jgi:N-acetylglucosamine-6-phosphate deacetylase